MPALEAVSREKHQGKSWRRFKDYAFASTQTVLPVVLAEISHVATTMPMAFVRQGEHFALVAVTSPVKDVNLFVSTDGAWLGAYVPAVLRGHPFALARAGGDGQAVLCVRDEAISPDPAEGEPFFADDGTPAKGVGEVLKFLGELERNREATQAAVDRLAQAGLIRPWDFQAGAEEERRETGLFRVDERRLTELDDAAFLDLRRSSGLPLAYAQLLSMRQTSVFQRLVTVRDQLARAQAARTSEPSFSLGPDDELIF